MTDHMSAALEPNLLNYLNLWCRFRGKADAITDGRLSMTWNELDAASSALAGQLQVWGVEPGTRVACFLPDCTEWCTMILAALKAGTPLVPLNHRYGKFDLQQIVEQVDCDVFFSTASLVPRIRDDFNLPKNDVISLFRRTGAGQWTVASYEDIQAQPPTCTPVDRTDEDIAVISFTSGTTGVPKGIMLMDRSIMNMTIGMMHAFRWTHDNRILAYSPLAFTGGVIIMFMSFLVTGGFICIPPDFKPETALNLIQKHNITMFGAVPPVWDSMSQLPEFADADLSSITTGIIGGAPCARHVLDRYRDKGVQIRQAYGASEGCGMVTTLSATSAYEKYYTAGKPLLNMELRVVDEKMNDMPVGEVGEIVWRGRSMMKGYWNNPEATAAAFKDEWFLSGDLGRLDEDGDIQIMDRKKNMVITGGVNVYPAEIERALGKIDGVQEIAAFGVPDDRWGEKLVCLIRADLDGFDTDGFRLRARELLGGMKTPKEFEFTDRELPRTASGKIGRRELPDFFHSLRAETITTSAE